MSKTMELRKEYIFLRGNNAFNQGYNARKGISEVYASFVLQCTVCGW